MIVVGGGELRDLTRELRKQADGKERAKELRSRLRTEAKPLVPAIKSNLRSLPSKRQSRARGRPSLRGQLARSVTLQVRTSGRGAGVSVFMNPRKMPEGKKGLPGYFENLPGKAMLRHPVFGSRDVWVRQYMPPAGYFTRAIGPLEERTVKGIRRVVDDMARKIEG